MIKWLDIIHSYFIHHYKSSNPKLMNRTAFIYNNDENDDEDEYNDNDDSKDRMEFDEMSYNFKILNPWNINNNININNNNNISDLVNTANSDDCKASDIDHEIKSIDSAQRKERYYDIYDPSKRCYYGWKYYKNNTMRDPLNNNEPYSQCFIQPFYKNLKQELLALLPKTIYDCEMNKVLALNNIKKDYISNGSTNLCRSYGINIDTEINDIQLLAICVYCDTLDFCKKLNDSFRQRSNENMEEWKLRHSKYGNMAKNLREIVECFGYPLNSTSIYYRGINKHYLFKNTLFHFNAPSSTTINLSKAEQFMNDNGLVLTLNKYDDRLTCFNCSKLSNYPNEGERLFIGGIGKLKIIGIYSRINGNLNKYISSISILNDLIISKKPDISIPISTKNNKHYAKKIHIGDNNTISKDIYNIFNILINNEILDEKENVNNNNVSAIYPQRLYHHFCEQKTKIFIDLNVIKNHYWRLNDIFISPDENWINLTLFAKLFPNLEKIIIRAMYIDRMTMRNLLHCLSEPVFVSNDNKINQIVLENGLFNEGDIDIYTLLSKFKDDIVIKGWSIIKNAANIEINRIKQDLSLLLTSNISDTTITFEHCPLSLIGEWILSSADYEALTISILQCVSLEQQILILKQQSLYCNPNRTEETLNTLLNEQQINDSSIQLLCKVVNGYYNNTNKLYKINFATQKHFAISLLTHMMRYNMTNKWILNPWIYQFLHCMSKIKRKRIRELLQINTESNIGKSLIELVCEQYKLQKHADIEMNNSINQWAIHYKKSLRQLLVHPAQSIMCFGTTFYYWPYHKQQPIYKDWFVESPYKSLEEEIKQNKICNISDEEWIKIVNEAKEISKKKQFESLIAHKNDKLNKEYDIKANTKMSLNHIIALLIFCKYLNRYSYELYHNKLNESFSRKSIDDSCKDLVNKHKAFVIQSKLLRECIEIYGKALNKNKHCFYTAFISNISSTRLDVKFFSPLYGTTDKIQLLHHCQENNNNGIIFELSKGDNIKYLDISQLFENDKDFSFKYIFIGDIKPWLIDNIFNINNYQNYSLYINAIRLFFHHILNGKEREKEKEKEKESKMIDELLMKLLCNQLSLYYPHKYLAYIGIPTFIFNLFDLCCNYMKCIEIDINKFKKEHKYFRDILLLNKCDMINMIIFTQLFPNCSNLILCNIEINESITSYLNDLKNESLLFLNPIQCEIQFKNKIVIDKTVSFRVDNDRECIEIKECESAATEKEKEIMLFGADRFEFNREIADTLQGRIYLVTDLVTNKQCVVKEAWKELVHSGRSRANISVPEDFLSERKLIMELSSNCTVDSLVRAIDAWDDIKCYYYAMEACCGELFEFINHSHKTHYKLYTESESEKEQIPISEPNKWIKSVQCMFKQICLGVEWMHNMGYCHLDLSLENTMISDYDRYRVKIIDFGLSQRFVDNNFIYQGRVGKIGYMSPEAFARKKYDARLADVYCLGIMLFMMLIGAPIYQTPHRQHPAFNYMINGRLKDILKHWKRLRIVTYDALDLLNKILRYENKRITLKKILKHPFITSYIEKEEEEEKEEEKEEEEEEKEEEINNDNNDNNDNESIHGLDSDDNEEEEEEEEEEEDLGGLDSSDDNMDIDDDNNDNDNDDDDDNKYESILSNGGGDIDGDIDGNMLCQLLLTEWGLQHCYPALKQSGWTYPTEWQQLTVPVLVYEVGLEKEESQRFIKYLDGYLRYKQQQKQKQKQSITK